MSDQRDATSGKWEPRSIRKQKSGDSDAISVADPDGDRSLLQQLAVLSALVPAAMVPWWFLYFDAVTKAAVILLGTSWGLLNVRQFENGLGMLASEFKVRLLLACLALQSLSLLVSSFWSASPMISVQGTGWRRLGTIEHIGLALFSVLLGAQIAAKPRGLLVVLRAFCLSTILTSAYGILQYAGWDPLLDPSGYQFTFGRWSIVRPPSTIGHATYFASYLVIMAFFSAACSLLDHSKVWRILGCSGTVVSVVALVLTGTRAGLLGFGVACLFLIARFRPKLTNRRVAVIVLSICASAAFYFSPPGDQLRNRVALSSGDTKGGPRLLLWLDCLKMAESNLLMGTGPETFGLEFPKYQSRELARAYPEVHHETAHNIYLEALLSQGVPGLAILLALSVLGLWASFAWRQDQTIAALLGAGLVGLIVAQQFTTFVLPTAFLFYLAVVVLVAGTVEAKVSTGIHGKPLRLVRHLAIPAAALFSAAAAQFLYVDARWASLNRDLQSGRLDEAVQAFPRVAVLYPPEPGAELWYSRALLNTVSQADDQWLQRRVWGQALDAAVRAVVTSDDRSNAWYNLAVLQQAQGNSPMAIAAIDEAIQSAPQWYKPHWMRAEILLTSGQPGLAEAETQIAVDLGGMRPELQELRTRAAAARRKDNMRQ